MNETRNLNFLQNKLNSIHDLEKEIEIGQFSDFQKNPVAPKIDPECGATQWVLNFQNAFYSLSKVTHVTYFGTQVFFLQR